MKLNNQQKKEEESRKRMEEEVEREFVEKVNTLSEESQYLWKKYKEVVKESLVE